MSKPKIAVLGSGDVGRALGAGFAAAGHPVTLGSREPQSEKLEAWKKKTGALTATFDATAKFGDVAVLSTAWSGTEHAIELAGRDNLAGKLVIDTTNPLAFGKGGPTLALGHDDSGGEQVQRWLPASKVVKAFNIVGNAHMVHPQFPGGPPDMFICGNDASSKKVVTGLLDAFGWNTVDIGGIEGARLLEPMCILWVKFGVISGSWNHAFKLLRK